MITPDSRAFWNRVARRYARMDIRNPDANEQTLDSIRAHLSEKGHVLELGCGPGTTAFRLSPSVRRYVATDYSSEMVGIALERQPPETRKNLDFCVGELGDENHPTGPPEFTNGHAKIGNTAARHVIGFGTDEIGNGHINHVLSENKGWHTE